MNKTYEEVDVEVWSLDLRIVERRRENPHCEDGPAYIRYHDDGSFSLLTCFRDGELHRDDGPAEIFCYRGEVFPGDTRTFEELEMEGAVQFMGWWLNGREQD